MKKIFFALVMMMTVLGAKAQVTTNVRMGVGFYADSKLGFNSLIQTNIPLTSGSVLTFSPSMEMNYSIQGDGGYTSTNLLLPLQFGCKIAMGGKTLFFPKVGPAVGYDFDADRTPFNVGVSFDLAFEYKHFVGALRGYYSFKEVEKSEYYGYYYYGYYYSDHYFEDFSPYNATITFGYKF